MCTYTVDGKKTPPGLLAITHCHGTGSYQEDRWKWFLPGGPQGKPKTYYIEAISKLEMFRNIKEKY
jgi:hypothetical protein